MSSSHSRRFYFRLKTEACAEQQEPQDFCGRDLMSPVSVAKMTKSLKTLGTRLAPGPQHLKQEKGKSRKKKGESGSSQLVKTEEKENALLFYYSL